MIFRRDDITGLKLGMIYNSCMMSWNFGVAALSFTVNTVKDWCGEHGFGLMPELAVTGSTFLLSYKSVISL
jgi:hypothetical protein